MTAEPIPRSRALVVAPAFRPSTAAPPMARPLAGFLAQLIATARRLPQARARRRADPRTAAAAYRVAAAPTSAAPHAIARRV